MPTPEVLRAINRATLAHHGVATSDQLPISRRQIDRCCESGVLVRRHSGVFVNASVPRSPLQDLAVAIAAGGPLAAAWGRSAAALWQLGVEFPDTPEIVVPRRRYARLDGAVVHRSSALTWEHLTHRDGLRVTNPLVTVVDLGVVFDPMRLAEVIITGRRRKLFEPAAIAATLSRLGRPGRTGIRNARAALELATINDRPADSVLEMRFALLAAQYGLPPYEYQHEVVHESRRYFIDFAYPREMVAIEVDGYEHRDTAASLAADDARQNVLVLDGWTFLRFTWQRVCADPQGVAAEVLALLRNRSHHFGA